MGKIRIGEATYTAEVKHAAGTLALKFENAKIEEVAAILDEDVAPEIRVMNKDGTTKGLYRNYALTRVDMEKIGGVRIVTAVLQTETIEQTEVDKLREEIAQLRRQLEGAE